MTGQRIIYVTGMKPKPDPAQHRPALMRVLGAGLGRFSGSAAEWLVARQENFVLVSWTSLMYRQRASIESDLPGIERLLDQPTPSERDRREADALWRNLLRAWHLVGDSYPWLSNLTASPALKETLAEVRLYLGNHDGVAVSIRKCLIDEIVAAREAGDRILLIGHSFGSVIAYDCLWQLSHQSGPDARIELYLSMGSPLATRFIRKGLQGSHLRGRDRYPANTDRWVNVSARGEMVALHRRVRPFFSDMQKLGLIRSIEDVPDIYNHFRADDTLNVHKSYGYLNHPVVAGLICRWLTLG